MAINIVFMYTDGCKIEKITRWQIHRIEVISYLCWCSFLFNTFTLHKANKSICICAFFRNEQVSNPNTTPFFCPPAYPNIHFCMTYITSYISRIKIRFQCSSNIRSLSHFCSYIDKTDFLIFAFKHIFIIINS